MADTAPKPPKDKALKGGSGIKKKVGPLPLWAWGVIVIGMYLGYRYYEKNKSASSAATDTTSSTDPSTLGTSADGSGASSGGADGTAAGSADNGGTSYDPYETLYYQLLGNQVNPGGTPDNLSEPAPVPVALSSGAAARAGEGTGGATNTVSPTSNAAGATHLTAPAFSDTPPTPEVVITSSGKAKLAPGVAGRAGVGSGGATNSVKVK